MYMNTVLLSVKYSTIPQKYKNFRKRSEDAQIIFVFTFILFYHFCFCFFIIIFISFSLKIYKISKIILKNWKLPFLFLSLLTMHCKFLLAYYKLCEFQNFAVPNFAVTALGTMYCHISNFVVPRSKTL